MTLVEHPEPCRIPPSPKTEGELSIWDCTPPGAKVPVLCMTVESAQKVAVLLRAYQRWRQEVAACPQIEQWSEMKKGLAPLGPALRRSTLRLARILDSLPPDEPPQSSP